MMESPANINSSTSQDEEDRISALPTDVLLKILEHLDLCMLVRTSVLSTRWRHLPHQLPCLDINVTCSHSTASRRQIMGPYKSATRLISHACNCTRDLVINRLRLVFYLLVPWLCSIGCAVDDIASSGKTKCLEFVIFPSCDRPSKPQLAEFGQQLMSFSRTYPITFEWLTGLTLNSLAFGDSDIPSLINASHRLERLSFRFCNLVKYSVLKIDAPCSRLHTLEFIGFRCARIELISVPELRRLECHSCLKENPPVRFGYVPQLHDVVLASRAKAWQTPVALGEFMSGIASNLSILCLNFSCQTIWVRPEHPGQRTPIFSNLRDVCFYNIFVECDLNWTLFILEAAPSLQKFHLSRHSCVNGSEDTDEKTNVVWEPSKNFKHSNLKLMVMNGFNGEKKVMDYVRLVMERAVGLKRIELSNKHMCVKCNALEYPRKFLVDDATKHRVNELLTHGFSSAVEIIID
ncbi:putative F-box/FBD/LRR-repeat protein At3g49030 isoform X2 [Lolium perenne]|uniref:putative F-box/FBD/LRR-repeat protein At3g49030 isoform X2 n=1 Tax=Lolium perenne TaxID=4522 RepID=UPI0021F580D6|nr:putative F-box/LRR-repeat protein At5g02700 isoform X2 [Lolium perenne]